MKSEPKSYLRFDYNLLLISVMAIFLRLFNIENQPLYCDEGMFMTISKFYVKQGLLVYTHWHHPPLKYFFFWSSSQLFSDNVIGYRMFSVVFGTLTVVVLYLLAKKVTGRLEIAFLASLFLAVDPFHITFSRVVIEEVAVGFFILLAVYLFLCFLEKPGPLCLWSAGISVGIAISLKWQALALIPALFAYYILHLTWRKKNKNPLTLFDVATFAIYFGLIPLSVYGLAYLPWFLKGHTLTEWLSIQRMMVQSISAVKGYMGTASTEQPLTWFVLPAYYILNYFQSPDGRFLLLCAWLDVAKDRGREKTRFALTCFCFCLSALHFYRVDRAPCLSLLGNQPGCSCNFFCRLSIHYPLRTS